MVVIIKKRVVGMVFIAKDLVRREAWESAGNTTSWLACYRVYVIMQLASQYSY